MTRICIILAVFLVTSLFSIADMWLQSEKTALLDKHGNYHIRLQNVPEADSELIRDRSDVAAAAWVDELNSDADKDYYIYDRKTVLYGVEEPYLVDIRTYLSEGSFPKNDSEILLSTDAKELFGMHKGDTVTLNTPAGDFDYTVSGFCEDDTMFNSMIDGCCTYMNRSAFQQISKINMAHTTPKYYIQFTEGVNLRKSIADIKEQYKIAEEKIEENVAVLSLSGASKNESAKNIYPMVGICFVLILISAILMISGCINSQVAQRTNFFGMLRCIGASKQQIIRYVRLEALNWCISSIPIGCLAGVVTNWIMCALLRFLVKGEWAYMPIWGVSVPGIVCGVAIGIITVFFAAHSPAKRAAKVSPVSAVSGSTETTGNARRMVHSRLFKIETALGIHHAVSAKKNLFLIAGSFALSIVLFLTFSAFLDVVRSLLPSLSSFSPDITIASQDDSNSIDPNLAAQIAEIPGVDTAFGTMYAIALPVQINGSETTIDLISYEKFMLDNTKKSVASGDLSKVYGNTDYGLTIFNQNSHLDVGDKIKIGDNEIEIACVASEGIGNVSDSPTVICSEETFTRLTSEQKYLLVNVILKEGAPEAAVNKIQNLAGTNSFTDRREDDAEIHDTYWVFRLAAFGFLVIISLITVLNIMNSISLSVSARIKQYGAMRAVGMEGRQITRMITAEAATYAICGTVVGDVIGLLFHYFVYEKILISHFGGVWRVPAAPLVIALVLVFVSCTVAVYTPSKRIQRIAITETINEL